MILKITLRNPSRMRSNPVRISSDCNVVTFVTKKYFIFLIKFVKASPTNSWLT